MSKTITTAIRINDTTAGHEQVLVDRGYPVTKGDLPVRKSLGKGKGSEVIEVPHLLIEVAQLHGRCEDAPLDWTSKGKIKDGVKALIEAKEAISYKTRVTLDKGGDALYGTRLCAELCRRGYEIVTAWIHKDPAEKRVAVKKPVKPKLKPEDLV